MPSKGWIVIPNWDRFQHPDVARNKHGIPPWIRTYTQLMNDDDFLALTFHQRGVLVSLWLEYATSRRQLRDSTSTVSRRLGQRVTRATLDALIHAGFLAHSASKPQADCLQAASPEERRGDTEDPQSPPTGKRAKPKPRRAEPSHEDLNPYRCGVGGCIIREASETLIAEHREVIHGVIANANGHAGALVTVPEDAGPPDDDIPF